MNRTLKVLLVIAITIAAIEICCLAVELLEPAADADMTGAFAAKAEIRWLVYWFSGTGLLVGGLLTRRGGPRLAGDALCIAGVYLMLLGNNGGLLSSGDEAYRIGTSAVTFAFLLLLALKDHKGDQAEHANA
jgi:hypothetical protein